MLLRSRRIHSIESTPGEDQSPSEAAAVPETEPELIIEICLFALRLLMRCDTGFCTWKTIRAGNESFNSSCVISRFGVNGTSKVLQELNHVILGKRVHALQKELWSG